MDGKVYFAKLNQCKSCLLWHSLNEKFDTYFFVIKILKKPEQPIHPDSANLSISIRQGDKINMCETSKESSVIRCIV